jgi:hypothetical protein
MSPKPNDRAALHFQLMSGVHELARAAQLTCLDASWGGARHAYSFRCNQGHEIRRRLDGLKARPYCGICARHEREHAGPLAALHREAAARGIRCLDTQWRGSDHSYRFRCPEGHEWVRTQVGSSRGRGCKLCNLAASNLKKQKRENLVKLQQLASSRGGICLSTEYLGVNLKYRFRCSAGHEWSAYPSVLVSGSWCKRCHFDSRLLGIEQAHEAAKLRGGRCLSEHYVASLSKLTWLCHRGHEWHAPLSAIKVGKWCKRCASMDRISNADSGVQIRYSDAGARLVEPNTVQR